MSTVFASVGSSYLPGASVTSWARRTRTLQRSPKRGSQWDLKLPVLFEFKASSQGSEFLLGLGP